MEAQDELTQSSLNLPSNFGLIVVSTMTSHILKHGEYGTYSQMVSTDDVRLWRDRRGKP